MVTRSMNGRYTSWRMDLKIAGTGSCWNTGGTGRDVTSSVLGWSEAEDVWMGDINTPPGL